MATVSEDRRQSLLSNVFDALPAGVLVLSETRRILTWNPALTSLLDGAVHEGATCCDVLGCGEAGGPLEDACITEAALAGRNGSHEHLIELPSTGEKVAVAARVVPNVGEAVVLLQIRAM